jgi:phosphoesterase RecJ-like protein
MDFKLKHQKALERIRQAQNILLACHERPDGDAVSSLCAMGELMKTLGKKHVLFCADEPDDFFAYLANFEKIQTDKDKFNFSDFDLIILLDCGQIARSKLEPELLARAHHQFLIEIDHHPKMENYSDLEIRNTEAAATAEIVYELFKTNKIKINKNTANCVLTGILTDTANFLYPSTTDRTMKIASEMLIRGAQMPQIVRNTWYNKTLPAMNLWGLALSKLKINKQYNLGFSVITLDEIKKIKDIEKVDSDIWSSIAGYMSNLHNVKGIMILREEEDGVIKGSLRSSHPSADISKLAKFFGGGGHPKSSGFSIAGKLEKINNNYQIRIN